MKIRRSIGDLIDRLKEQHDFLKQSCRSYDDGCENEAKRIAVCLRVLLHDTKNSRALLSQLNIKETTKFLNTAHLYNEKNLLPSSYLTFMRLSGSGGMVLPLLTEYLSSHPWPKYKNFAAIPELKIFAVK